LEEEQDRMRLEPAESSSDNPGDNKLDSQHRKIFVGGLPQNLEIEEFRSYFAKFGLMDDCVIL